jgi:Cdc6-like AAA superfamily ATPase
LTLVLYACIRLLSQDTNNGKVTLMDVYIEYRRLTDELNITSPSMSGIQELARELETLGFLKCTYPRKRDGRVGYVRIFEPAQMPRYASILKEELGMVKLEEDTKRM